MYSIKEYRIPATLEEADTLLHEKKSNTLIAGGMWLHMTAKKIDTAVDLSKLGLDLIAENDTEVRIGAMVPLRELEVNPAVSKLWNGVLAKAVSPIVGTQFRNSATVGASVFSRFGFSDVITALLALGAKVSDCRARPSNVPTSATIVSFASVRRQAGNGDSRVGARRTSSIGWTLNRS